MESAAISPSVHGTIASPSLSNPGRSSARQHLSAACARSVHKLNGILEEYRAKRYARECPRLFREDVVRAAAVGSRQLHSSAISARGIERVLRCIGAGRRMPRSEIEGIVSEVGICLASCQGWDDCFISAGQMLDLISIDREEDRPELGGPARP